MRVPELAVRLGLTRRVAYGWIAQGVIPAAAVVRAGRSLYLKSPMIEAWLVGRDGQQVNAE